MLNKEQSQAVLTKALDSTKLRINATLNSTSDGTTRIANSEINQNVSINDMALSVTVYDGKKFATNSTNVLTDEGIKKVVAEAEELVKFVPESEYEAFPFSKEPVAEVPFANLAADFGPVKRADILKEGLSFIEKDFTAAGALNLNQNSFAIASSDGGFRYAAIESIDFNTVVTHKDGAAGSGDCVSYKKVPDIVSSFKKAQKTSAAARNPISPELGSHTVVLSPSAFGDLVGFMGYMMNAKAVDDGISFAIGKIGEKVFGDNFTLTDFPGHPELMQLPFDFEGNPRTKLTLVDKGVVKELLYDNVLAKRHGKKSTGHGFSYGQGGYPMHMVVEAGDKSEEEIIKGTKKGVYINEFHYTNFVNPRNLQITGLTRNGTFLIEDGVVTKPIATVRFTVSLLDIFNKITAVTKEQVLSGRAFVPGVKIEEFTFTSKP